MKCPFCRSRNTEVYNSRTTKFENQIWRRRRCQQCHEAFTTYEAADLGFLKVLKQSGRPERYSRAKLYSSLAHALQTVPHQETTIDAVTDSVEAKLLDLKKKELSSQEIASIVLSTLKHFNVAAFMRYLADQGQPTSTAELNKILRRLK